MCSPRPAPRTFVSNLRRRQCLSEPSIATANGIMPALSPPSSLGHSVHLPAQTGPDDPFGGRGARAAHGWAAGQTGEPTCLHYAFHWFCTLANPPCYRRAGGPTLEPLARGNSQLLRRGSALSRVDGSDPWAGVQRRPCCGSAGGRGAPAVCRGACCPRRLTRFRPLGKAPGAPAGSLVAIDRSRGPRLEGIAWGRVDQR